MSLISIELHDDGSPAHLTYRVTAIDRDDAMLQAKAQCRLGGYTIKTAGGVKDLGSSIHSRDHRLHDFNVVLVARPKA